MDLLKELPSNLKPHISSLCIDGTSSTALLIDSRQGDLLAPTKIYNEDQGVEPYEATKVTQIHYISGSHLLQGPPHQHVSCCWSSFLVCAEKKRSHTFASHEAFDAKLAV